MSKAIWRRVAERPEPSSPFKLPVGIVDSGALVVANDLRGETAARPAIALGVWARFAGVRERIGVRVLPPEHGLAAEIAATVRPELILLADSWRGRSLVVAASDQVAAELAGLAIRQASGASDEAALGPWQDPLVQRATELDLGVRIPEQIALRAVWQDSKGGSGCDEFRGFIAGVCARLGIPEIVVECVSVPHDVGGDASGLV